MKKIATILVALLILSSIGPHIISASSLETNEEAIEQANEQTVLEEQENKEEIIGTESNEEIVNNEENNELVETPEINEDEQGDQATNEDQSKEDIQGEQEIPTEENDVNDESEKSEVEEDVTITQDESEEEEEANEEEQSKVVINKSIASSGSSISRLGHIRSSKVDIYKDLNDLSSSFKAGSTYTNKVYYIKQQNTVSGKLYYLISTAPSSSTGVVGWIKASDLSTHSHVGVNKASETLYVKGTGNSYDTAWGGSKNLVYNLSKYEGQIFKVHLTEKVGNNIWYRGTLNGKTVWIHSSYLTSSIGSSTSKLGHIRNSNARIYSGLEDNSSSITAGSKYTNAVYYIKSQTKTNGQTYYLISTQPSNSKGVVGWVRDSDLSIHTHIGVDKKAKTLYFKGTGSAYSKAWGGTKDLIHSNMSQYAGQEFKVNLTEKVGNNTWYRGTFNGKTIWLHSSYVTTKTESNTSRLGHLRTNVKIYKSIGDYSSAIDGNKYTNAVYYIKKQAEISNQLYYLISTSPSSTNGVIGWVNSKDVSSHPHVGVDKKAKTLYIKGTGSAYAKAWGGAKDIVYKDMSQYVGKEFKVHLTEKVGKNTWYRGTFNGKTIWLHSSYVNIAKNSNYNLTLNEALKIQMKATPQTDTKYAWVSKEYIDGNNKVTATTLNVRLGPGTSGKEYGVIGTLSKGAIVNVLDEYNDWYAIEYSSGGQWRHASPADVAYYLDPLNFINDPKQQFQFLDLSKSSGTPVNVLNNYLKGKGVLEGMGQAFIDASRINGINDIYLVSHASLETGNGSSSLAKGLPVDKNGKITRDSKNNIVHNAKTAHTVYNIYGYGAYDSCPIDCGAQYAFDNEWFTIKDAIIGGAVDVGKSYINNGQNTLYKMRWNPAAMASTGEYGRQYATDIGWASKQINTMYNLYQKIGSYTINLDIPVYK